MPRGGRSRMGSRSKSRGVSPTRYSATHHQAPSRSYNAAPSSKSTNTGSRGGFLSGLGGTVVQGMAFGAGSEVAHQAVRGVMGDRQQQDVKQQQQPVPNGSDVINQQQNVNKCYFENTQFIDCLKTKGDSISLCQSFFNVLKDCEKKLA